MSVDRISWQYLAGFFDGEGSILVRPNAVQFSIGQSKQRGLDVLREIQFMLASYGLKSSIYIAKGINDCHTLYVTNRPVIVAIINNLMPYLRVKRVEAQDVLRFIKLYPVRNFGKINGRAISLGKQRAKDGQTWTTVL